MATIDRIAAQFRADLMAEESRAVVRMTRAYASALVRVNRDLAAITARIATARAQGEPLGTSWLFQEERLANLKREAETQLAVFARQAAQETEERQTQAVAAAAEQSTELMTAALGPGPVTAVVGVQASFVRLPASALTELVGRLGNGSPLRSLFDTLPALVGDRLEQGLITGLAAGLSPRVIAREVQDGVSLGLNRALLIARTEVLRAHREATRLTYQSNADVVEGWVWHANLGTRTCAACLALHGSFHPLDERLDGHPGCRCFPAGTVVSGPRSEAASSRRFDGEVVDLEFASGAHLTATINHPILTPEGWVAAGLLDEGDNVLGCRDGHRVMLDPDDRQVPAFIEQVADTFPIARLRAPNVVEDFHGDGGGSEVCVVRTDGLLGNGLDSKFPKILSEQQLALSYESKAFLGGLRTEAACFPRAGSPSHCVPCLQAGEAAALLVRSPGPAMDEFSLQCLCADVMSERGLNRTLASQVFGDSTFHRGLRSLAPVTPNATLNQGRLQRDLAGMVDARSVLAALAGRVVSDRVLKVRRRAFRGHVYSLQTSQGWHFASSDITARWVPIASNCSMVPRTMSWQSLGYSGIPETRPEIEVGTDWFARQDEATQRAVLGNAGYEAFRSGEVTLKSFVARRSSPEWGAMNYARSLKAVREGRGGDVLGAAAIPAPPR